jgi:hypothetical protein
MSLFTDASRVTAIGAQLTLSESRLSDGFAPMNEPARAGGERSSRSVHFIEVTRGSG